MAPKIRGKKYDRRGSGPWWFIAIGVLAFAMYSLTVATATRADCHGGPKHWEFFPPAWECDRRIGFG
jgi:hypothetical protein